MQNSTVLLNVLLVWFLILVPFAAFGYACIRWGVYSRGERGKVTLDV